MKLINRVLEERAKAWDKGREILERASKENRDLTSEENEAFDRANAEITKFDERIRELEDLERRNKAAADAEAEYREVLDANKPKEPEKTPIHRMAAGELRAYDFGWDTMRPEFRDLTVGTATDGAELVPTSFVEQLYVHLIENSAIIEAGATVINTASGEQILFPKTTSLSTALLEGEGDAIAESDPQFAQMALDAYKYAFLTQASFELVQDSAVNLEGFLAAQGGQALGNAFGAHAITGTGTAQPKGVMTAATGNTSTNTGVAGVPQYDDIVDLVHAVIPAYRRNAGFLMSDATLAGIRKLEDSNGLPLWQPSVQSGVPSQLLGFPVTVDPNVADAATSAESVAFGDFSKYYVRFAGGVRVERSDDYAFANDLITWKFAIRADGDLIDTGAIKTFTGAAT